MRVGYIYMVAEQKMRFANLKLGLVNKKEQASDAKLKRIVKLEKKMSAWVKIKEEMEPVASSSRKEVTKFDSGGQRRIEAEARRDAKMLNFEKALMKQVERKDKRRRSPSSPGPMCKRGTKEPVRSSSSELAAGATSKKMPAKKKRSPAPGPMCKRGQEVTVGAASKKMASTKVRLVARKRSCSRSPQHFEDFKISQTAVEGVEETRKHINTWMKHKRCRWWKPSHSDSCRNGRACKRIHTTWEVTVWDVLQR